MPKSLHTMTREELEDECFALRQVVYAERHDQRLAALMMHFALTPNQARIALALFDSRTVSRERVVTVAVRPDHAKTVNSNLAAVYVSQIRKKLGGSPLIAHAGIGYSLSEEGRALVAQALENTRYEGDGDDEKTSGRTRRQDAAPAPKTARHVANGPGR